MFNRSRDQGCYIWNSQLRRSLQLDKANLLSRSPQQVLRVRQLRALAEIQKDTFVVSAKRQDGINASVAWCITDDERLAVVVDKLIG